MDMNNLISECTAYDYKSKLEENDYGYDTSAYF